VAPVNRPAATPADSKPIFRGPGQLLTGGIDGFDLSANPRYFNGENLYELINGGADIYAAYGLREMVTADYRSRSAKRIEVSIEIYDLGRVEGAFGRMARFLSGRRDPTGAGVGLPPGLVEHGLFGGSDAIFCKGPYLVHLVLVDASPHATAESMTQVGQAVLPPIAAALAGRMGDSRSRPALLGRFPETGRIRRGEAWEPRDPAGVSGVGAGYSVRYRAGQRDWVLLVTDPLPDARNLTTTLKALGGSAWVEKGAVFDKLDRRIVGFLPGEGRWTQNDLGLARDQIAALQRGLGSPEVP
jgi:hypothetical protein